MESAKKICDIALGQQNCQVVGRLTRLWDSRNMRSKFDSLISIDGILVDEDGAMVQITIPKRLETHFRSLISNEEGSVCLFTNLNAIDIKQRTYTYHHQPYMLQFQETSKVQRLNSRGADIPQFAFKFCPFNMMASKDVPLKSLIDLIGVITHVGPHDFASATSQIKLRKVKIIDLEEQTQEIQLWGEHGESFDEATVIERSKQGIVVVVFAGFTSGSFKVKKASVPAKHAVSGFDKTAVKKDDFSFTKYLSEEGQGRGALSVQACRQRVFRESHPAASRGAQELCLQYCYFRRGYDLMSRFWSLLAKIFGIVACIRFTFMISRACLNLGLNLSLEK